MDRSFDINLVERFVTSVRQKGASVLSSAGLERNWDEVSTPAMTWFITRRENIPSRQAIEDLLLLDEARSQTVVGHNVFKNALLEKYPQKERLYSQAMEIIAIVWPDAERLIEAIGIRLSFQTEDRSEFESESNPKTFGEIIFNMKSACPVHWAEILVHEIAHHYLTVLLGTTKIPIDTMDRLKQKAFSFQRQTERPLVGVLHGVFAQSCILIFASRILLSSDYSDRWGEGAKVTFKRFAAIFPNDLLTVRDADLLFHEDVLALVNHASFEVAKVEMQSKESLWTIS